MKGCLSFFVKMVGVFALLLFIIVLGIINSTTSSTIYSADDYASENCEEKYIVQLDSNQTLNSSVQRSWLNYSSSDFCFDYNISYDDKINSAIEYEEYKVRTRWSENNDAIFYGEVYQSLYESDKEYLQLITDSLLNLAEKEQLNTNQTAEMIVSLVQDIPYSYVFDGRSCADRENKGYKCVDGKRFGLLTPVEFLYTLIGDCDTRSVLLYLILKQLNYDISIVVSREYAHAMIAINLPYEGDYLEHNEKKYYFWETTATGWIPGVLPPDCNNKNYWQFALI